MCGFTYPDTHEIRASNRLSEYQIQLNLDKYYNKLKASRNKVKSNKRNKRQKALV